MKEKNDMKKHSLYSPFLRLALVSLFVLPFPSCVQYEELQAWDSIGPEKKSDVDPDVPAEDNPIVTFSVGLNPDEETEIGIEVQDGSLHTKWMAGDQIRVVSFDVAGSIVTNGEKLFTIQPGFTDHEASFSGTKVEGSGYALLHPADLLYSRIQDLPFNGLVQSENNSTAHLKYCATLCGLTSHPSDLPDSKVAFSEDFVYALRESMPTLDLKKSSYIHNRLGLPAAVKTVQRVEMEALPVDDVPGSERIFHSSNREESLTSVLLLYLDDVVPAVNEKGNKVLDSYMAIPWWGYTMQPGQKIKFSVFYTDESDAKKVVSKTLTNSEGLVTKAYNGLCVHNNVNLINASPSASVEDGSAENPYLLSTASDLLSIKSRLREGDGQEVYFRMENDIDLAGIDWVPISNTSPYNRTIHFDGNGKIIYNLRCVNQEYASFFGVLIGECHDLGFVNAYVMGNGSFAGIFAGYLGTAGVADGVGALNRCFCDGIVDNMAGGGVGGLVGATGYSRTGSDNVEINDCYCSALIRNENNSCGGLVGAARVSEDHGGLHIKRTHFCGVIDSHYGNVGGLLGNVNEDVASRMFITDCAVMAKVLYNDRTNGTGTYQNIAGGTQSRVTVSSTKVWNGVLGRARYDGVGSDDLSSIQSQFAAFSAWSSTTGLNGEPLLDWVVARDDYDDAPPASCGGDDPARWEGATTNAGIRSYYFDSGTGEAADEPYLISRTFQLYQMEPKMKALYDLAGGSVSTSYFKLGADIDMAPVAWDPLNNDSAAYYDKMYIDFDGNGKTIDHLNCNAGSYPSFFGVLNGNVRNLSFNNATITGNNSSACGVVAAFLGSGSGCSSSAERITISNSTISAGNSNYRGALAGNVNKAGSTISDISVLDCTVSGNGGYVGGIIGYIGADATLSGRNFVSGTSVSGNGQTGGIIGGVGNVEVTVNISGCTYTGGTVRSTGRYTGGLVGVTGTYSTTKFSDCHVENATVDLTGCASLTTVSGGGFAGNLNANSEAKGCSVGTADQPVSILSVQPAASGSSLTVGGFVGELRGTISRNGNVRTKAYVTISCSNTLEAQELRLSGFCGYPTDATIEYSDVVATMTGLTGRNIAGLCANINGACKIDHCTVTANVSGSSYVGGLVGWVNGGAACTITNCSVSGSVSATGGSVGGLAGRQNSNVATISDVSSSMTVTSQGQNSGGLVGQIAGGTITRCAVSGNVTCTGLSSGSNSLAGGLFGRVAIDSLKTLTMSCCAYSGTVSATGRQVGGLIGCNNGAGTLSVSDCQVSGNVIAGGQWAGGILGAHSKGIVSLTNCLVTGSVTGYSGVGGIYGSSTTTKYLSLSLVRCMSYHSSIRGTSTEGTENDFSKYSCGAALGYYRAAVVVDHCYRKPNLDFLDCQPANSGNVLVDNEFITSAAAIPLRYTGYSYSHHGKENPYASLSALVTSGTIGGDWDASIWDLSGDVPSLWFLGNLEGYSKPVSFDWGD